MQFSAPAFAQVAENHSVPVDGRNGSWKVHPGILDGAWDLRDDVDPLMIYRVKPDLDPKMIMRYELYTPGVSAQPGMAYRFAFPDSLSGGFFRKNLIDSMLHNFKYSLPADSSWRRWMNGDTFHLHLPEYKLDIPSPFNVVPESH